jgi:hypothetical protein
MELKLWVTSCSYGISPLKMNGKTGCHRPHSKIKRKVCRHITQNAIFRIDGMGNYSPIPPVLCVKSPIACDITRLLFCWLDHPWSLKIMRSLTSRINILAALIMRIITRSSEFLALAFDRLWPLSCVKHYASIFNLLIVKCCFSLLIQTFNF